MTDPKILTTRWGVDSKGHQTIHAQMEHPFVYAKCVPEAYKNGTSVYVCKCGVVEYLASKNGTPSPLFVEN